MVRFEYLILYVYSVSRSSTKFGGCNFTRPIRYACVRVCACVRARVCACVCVRACVRACVRVCVCQSSPKTNTTTHSRVQINTHDHGARHKNTSPHHFLPNNPYVVSVVVLSPTFLPVPTVTPENSALQSADNSSFLR